MTRYLRTDLTDELIERMLAQRAGSRAPEDLVKAIISSAATTPQRRQHLVPAFPLIARPRTAWLKVGAVLALLGIIAAAAVVGSYLLRPRSTLVPAVLQAEWQPVGTHSLPGLSGPSPALDISVGQTTITIHNWHVDVLNSASFVGPDRLEVRASNMGWYWHCQVGDVGTYAFSTSSGDQRLTLTPVSDTCMERATVLNGDWTRTDIGDLAAGRRVSPYWTPFDRGTSGQFSYAVPSGWAAIDESSDSSIMARSNASEQAEIRMLANVVPESQDGACALIRPAVGSTPAAVAAWLADLPGLVVTSPTAIKVGGLSGVMVDLSVVPGWTNTCPNEQSGGPGRPRDDAPFVYTFSDPAHRSLGTGCCLRSTPLLIVAADRRVRYLLLDRGDGSTLVIDIEARDNATRDAAVSDAMRIVDTFAFTR
jgi:hypothetical protein